MRTKQQLLQLPLALATVSCVLMSAPVAFAFGPEPLPRASNFISRSRRSFVARPDAPGRAGRANVSPLRRLDDLLGEGERRSSGSVVELRLFKRLFGGGDDDDEQKKKEAEKNEDKDKEDKSQTTGADGSAAPFFAQTGDGEESEVVAEKEQPETTAKPASAAAPAEETGDVDSIAAELEVVMATEEVAAAVTEPEEVPAPAPPAPAPAPAVPRSALDEAKQLRAAANRVRLEAEKMDALLSLEKLDKLEKELGTKAVRKDPDRATAIRNQIDSLKRKLAGEDSPAPASVGKAPGSSSDGEAASSTNKGKETSSLVTGTVVYPDVKPLSKEELRDRVQKYDSSPKFMKEVIARAAGIDFMDIAEINATALVAQLHEDEQKYLSIQEEVIAGMPKFTQQQIDEKLAEVQQVPGFMKSFYGEDANNDTAIAIKMLETEWESDQMSRSFKRRLGQNLGLDDQEEGGDSTTPTSRPANLGGGGSPFGGSNLFDEMREQGEKTDIENMVESLFPKSTRKEDAMPTEAQAKVVMEDVVSKVKKFNPTGRPEAVPGGYLIRGTNNFDNGEALIDAIDAGIAKSRVRDQVSVHFVADPTPVSDEQLMMSERNPVLFITGKDIGRDANRFLLAAVTSAGIATTWYTSLYPYLLNPTLLKKAEEQLTLANAGMEYDLNWLTNMGIPIFISFLGVQIAHEAAHWAVAKSNKMDITLPTLVPSLVTGITTGITALKTPARNKQQLFDFAIVGPLTGIALSILLMFVGCEIAASLDAAAYANLPALPLVVLRESSLAGGIIESFLGNGALQVPASAAGTQAIADINIGLHPFAIAGFFSLLVNAINLVPFGRTDGGRVSLALFGRSGAQLVGLLSLASLLIVGLFSSDLLLFYFSYVLFFQNEAEIPCRNEVDDITFSRILLSTFTGVVVLLTLIPMS